MSDRQVETQRAVEREWLLAELASAYVALSRIGAHGALTDNERSMIDIARAQIGLAPDEVRPLIRAHFRDEAARLAEANDREGAVSHGD